MNIFKTITILFATDPYLFHKEMFTRLWKDSDHIKLMSQMIAVDLLMDE